MPTRCVGSGEDTGSNRREPFESRTRLPGLPPALHGPITFLGVVDVGCSTML
jgi:hypothetical protein